MSSFMPEPGENPYGGLSDDDRALIVRLFGHPLEFPKEFWAAVLDRVARDIPQIPESQLFGTTRTAKVDTQEGSSSTTSTTYADLGDGVHPEIADLVDGTYAVWFGAKSSGSGTHRMGISVNGAAPTAALEVRTNSGGFWVATATLSDAPNKLTAKYKGSDGTSVSWELRYLMALKTANV